jgi:hypothetical protein
MNRMGIPQPDYTPDGVLAEIARVVPFFKGAARASGDGPAITSLRIAAPGVPFGAGGSMQDSPPEFVTFEDVG